MDANELVVKVISINRGSLDVLLGGWLGGIFVVAAGVAPTGG